MSRNSNTPTPDSLARVKTFFYGRGADAKIIFNSGSEEIKLNKELLAFFSPFFDEIFFGETQKSEYFESDFDSTTFKLFLDCLLEFKPYTDLDSLLIFPIAYKYRTELLLKKCIEALKPKAMNETVCHTLNLALYYQCQDLINNVTDFLKRKFSIRSLLEEEKYCSVLEPISMAKLVESIEVDSDVMKIIFSWAKTYLKNRKKSVSISSFLSEHKIFKGKFRFESFQSIFDFQEAEETRELFTAKELCSLMKSKLDIAYPRRFPNNSMWVLVKKGETITESFSFAKAFGLHSRFVTKMTLEVWRNETIFLEKFAKNKNPVSCQISFVYSHTDSSESNYPSLGIYNDFRKSDILTESRTVKKDGKSIYEVSCPASSECFLVQPLHVIYTFNVNCRILKTSMEGLLTDDGKSLYYTYHIRAEDNTCTRTS